MGTGSFDPWALSCSGGNLAPADHAGSMVGLAGTDCQEEPTELAEKVAGLLSSICAKSVFLSSWLSKKISSVFRCTYARAGAYFWQQGRAPGRALAPCPGGGAFSCYEARVDALSTGMQESGEAAVCSLPSNVTEAIFSSLSLKDSEAFSMTCRRAHVAFREFQRQRWQALLSADAQCHLLKRFGIHCPIKKGPLSHAQVRAMVTRTQTIIDSMNVILYELPESSPPKQTAEELVMRFPPTELLGLLKTAYRCNLYGIFAGQARLASEVSLEAATPKIQEWLRTKGAKLTKILLANAASITCIPREIGRLSKLKMLVLSQNQIAFVPPEVGQLTGLEVLKLGQNPLIRISAGLGRLRKLSKLQLDKDQLGAIPADERRQLSKVLR